MVKRARTGVEQTKAAVEEDPTEHTYSMPKMYQRLDEIGVEQGRQWEELQGLRGDFQGFRSDYQRDMGSLHHMQRYMFELQYPSVPFSQFFYDPYSGVSGSGSGGQGDDGDDQ